MGDDLSRIEFLESSRGPEDIAWIDVDEEPEESLGGSHGSSLLPPRTTVRRILVSLLIFALALSTTGWAGVDAFRHDQAVQARGNELVLREADVVDPMRLTDPGELGALGGWRVDPSASIAVGVTNESPDPITLLPDAALSGPGMARPATLQPPGAGQLRPGQSAELTGVATVDCGIEPERVTGGLGEDSILVQARTASGATGVATVALDGGAESIRAAICTEEGDALAADFFPQSVDTAQHTFTLVVSARSLAAQSLRYRVTEAYSTSEASFGGLTIEGTEGSMYDMGVPSLPGATSTSDLPGVRLSAPVPNGPVAGTLAAGAALSAGFTVRVLTCPSSVPTTSEAVDLEVLLNQDGTPAVFQADGFDLGTLVGAACGLLA